MSLPPSRPGRPRRAAHRGSDQYRTRSGQESSDWRELGSIQKASIPDFVTAKTAWFGENCRSLA